MSHPDLAAVLAKLYKTESRARAVLERADIPVERIPWDGTASPLDNWQAVMNLLRDGLAVDGEASIVRVALEEHPANVDLRRLAGREEGEPATAADGSAPDATAPSWLKRAGKIKLSVPFGPFFRYENEITLEELAMPPKLWIPLVVLVAIAAGVVFWITRPSPPELPELYAVRVVVRDAQGQAVEGAKVRASTGNEAQYLPADGWWEIEIPRVKVPLDGKVSITADHQGVTGKAELTLEADPNVRAEIDLPPIRTTIRGHVSGPDDESVADARVSIPGFPSVASDGEGNFVLETDRPKGELVRVRTEHPGYPPKEQNCYADNPRPCYVVLLRGE